MITGGSAFNIKAKSLRLGDFRAEETRTLLLEHTQETGQLFTPEALEQVWTLTQGQPWLVGAVTLGMELKVWRDGRPDPLAEGLKQLDAYLAGLGLDGGWLVIFDRRAGQPSIEARPRSESILSPEGRRIILVRA